jgi:hypothetical protein
MRPSIFILASGTLFALGMSSAIAGPCTIEIDNLTKALAAQDAGSGPSPGASGGTRSAGLPSDQHPPTAAMSQAAQGTATSAEDVRRQTAGQPTAAAQRRDGPAAQHPPTAAMSQATQGQTAPVTSGQHPPTAVMSEATRSQAAPSPSAAVGNMSEASLMLNRARTLDQQGKEAECMEAVRQTRLLARSTLAQNQQQQSQAGSAQGGQGVPSPDQAQGQQVFGRAQDQDRVVPNEILGGMERRLGWAKEALQLTPDQEKNWPALQSALSDVVKLLVQRMSDRRDQPLLSPVERLRRNADHLGSVATALTRLADAEEPLYNSLNDAQKERFARLTRIARLHLARLGWQSHTGSMAEDPNRYRSDRYEPRGRSRDDEDDGWRGRSGMGWRDLDDEDGWRGRFGMMRRDRMMDEDEDGWRGHRGMRYGDRMMGGDRMMDDDEDGARRWGRMHRDWRRHRHLDYWRGGWQRYHGRGMMDGWRGRDCEPDRD